MKRAVKCVPQAGGKRQRASEIQNIPADRPPLRKTGNRLVYNRLIDRSGNIPRCGALVDQRLHITLGKYTAAGSDRICSFGLFCGFVHLRRIHFHQHRHLVNKRAGASGTASVHPHFRPSGQEQDFGILTAELDNTVCVR